MSKPSDKLTSVHKLDQEIRRALKNKPKKSKKVESQGPIDWSHQGLKSKYRGQTEREDAWRKWKESISLSQKLIEDAHQILPVVRVERHPVVRMYYQQLDEENFLCNTRTKSRLLMKKFVLDVQEVWLANLQHLREHQPQHVGESENNNKGNASNPPTSPSKVPVMDDDSNRGLGLSNRRDIKAILNLDHQIQSVSQKRVFHNAYHTTKLPPVQVIMDYKPSPPPILPEARPGLPHVENLINGISFGEYTLCIDRLIPSHDLIQTNIMPDILWRVCTVHTTTLVQHVYVTTETHVATYIAHILTHPIPAQSTVLSTYSAQEFIPIPYSDGSVEWEGLVEVRVCQSPYIYTSPIYINLNIQLRPYNAVSRNGSNLLTLSLQCSALEIIHILQSHMPSQTHIHTHTHIYDGAYWADTLRIADTYSHLCTCVCIEADASIQGMYRTPIAIHLKEGNNGSSSEKIGKFWEKIEGALTHTQSLSCVYELFNSIHIHNANAIHEDDDSHSQSTSGTPLVEFFHADHTLHMLYTGVDESLINLHTQDNTRPSRSPHDMRQQIRRLAYTGMWEELHRQMFLVASMQASQLFDQVNSVPGACVMGKKGMWFVDANEPEEHLQGTQVAAHFFRDIARSTTDSILVNMLHMIDAAIHTPLCNELSVKKLSIQNLSWVPQFIPCMLLWNTVFSSASDQLVNQNWDAFHICCSYQRLPRQNEDKCVVLYPGYSCILYKSTSYGGSSTSIQNLSDSIASVRTNRLNNSGLASFINGSWFGIANVNDGSYGQNQSSSIKMYYGTISSGVEIASLLFS